MKQEIKDIYEQLQQSAKDVPEDRVYFKKDKIIVRISKTGRIVAYTIFVLLVLLAIYAFIGIHSVFYGTVALLSSITPLFTATKVIEIDLKQELLRKKVFGFETTRSRSLRLIKTIIKEKNTIKGMNAGLAFKLDFYGKEIELTRFRTQAGFDMMYVFFTSLIDYFKKQNDNKKKEQKQTSQNPSEAEPKQEKKQTFQNPSEAEPKQEKKQTIQNPPEAEPKQEQKTKPEPDPKPKPESKPKTDYKTPKRKSYSDPYDDIDIYTDFDSFDGFDDFD